MERKTTVWLFIFCLRWTRTLAWRFVRRHANHYPTKAIIVFRTYTQLKSVFDKYPNIKIVQEVYADWDYAKAKRAMENLLAAYPKIHGVWSQGGAMSEAVVEAYLERNECPPPVTGESEAAL